MEIVEVEGILTSYTFTLTNLKQDDIDTSLFHFLWHISQHGSSDSIGFHLPVKMSLVSRCVKQFQSKCSFSIDHILNVAGEKTRGDDCSCNMDEDKKFEWLSCTRYRPPKLQRQRKREGIQRRKPGRNPRIPFSSSQVAFLEAKFVRTPYLSSTDVTQLAANLQLSETRVKIWFQNRRARERRDREMKSKVPQSPKDIASQPSGFKELSMEECFIPQYTERNRQIKDDEIDFNNSIRIDFNAKNSFVQIFKPLDLSERNFLYK